MPLISLNCCSDTITPYDNQGVTRNESQSPKAHAFNPLGNILLFLSLVYIRALQQAYMETHVTEVSASNL